MLEVREVIKGDVQRGFEAEVTGTCVDGAVAGPIVVLIASCKQLQPGVTVAVSKIASQLIHLYGISASQQQVTLTK